MESPGADVRKEKKKGAHVIKIYQSWSVENEIKCKIVIANWIEGNGEPEPETSIKKPSLLLAPSNFLGRSNRRTVT